MTFLFLIGTGRCGSTLVQQALCGHPHIGFVARADDRLRRFGTLGRHNNRLYRRMGSPLDRRTRGGVRGKLPSLGKYSQPYAPAEAYAVLNRNVSRMLSTPCRDLTAATPRRG